MKSEFTRRRFYERDTIFTWDEKVDIAKKSGDHCCHCGKLCYFGYGATVDHFIPLYKGGSNRMHNLLLLCKDCNKEKDDKIVDMSYFPWLKDKYKAEMHKYLEDYIHTFDYIERNRIFACDEYSIFQETVNVTPSYRKKSKKPAKSIGIRYKMKYATWADMDKLCDYFVRFLKKYHSLGSEQAAFQNITFWLRFGCIYYLERNGEIQVMYVFTVKHEPEVYAYHGNPYVLNMYAFSYYSTGTAKNLVLNSIYEFPRFLMKEQGLKHIPICVQFVDEDPTGMAICDFLDEKRKSYVTPLGFRRLDMVLYKEQPDPDDVSLAKLQKFMDKFDNVLQSVKSFYASGEGEWVDWMVYDVLNAFEVEELHLFEGQDKLGELNKKFVDHYEKLAGKKASADAMRQE